MILRMGISSIILLGQAKSVNSLQILAPFAFKMELDQELPTYLLLVVMAYLILIDITLIVVKTRF